MPETVPKKISVLMPAYNEGRHIYRNIRETAKVLRQFTEDYELVIVDDGSRDNTWEEIQRASEEIDNVITFSYPENRGKGWALKRAFRLCSGDWIFFLDSDLDIHPRQFDTFFQVQARTGADVVIGSKRHPRSTLHYPLSRRLISGIYFSLVKLLFGLPLRDTQTGIKLFKRVVLEKIMDRILVKKYAFDLEILVNAHHQGFTIAEAPVVVDYKGVFGRIGLISIWTILTDTLAIFYRMNLLKYYDRPMVSWPGKPAVSILIPFKKATPYLDECLAKISELDYEKYEMLLLPDGPMKEKGEKIRVIPTGAVGPPRKRDMGVERSKGEIIAFIDDDAYPQEDWLKAGVRHFGDESIAAVGGPASPPPTEDFREKMGGRVLSSWMVGGVHVYRSIPKMLKEVDDYPTSNLLVRKSAFLEAGGFQSPYWPGEDTVLCWKITHRLNKKIIYDPDVQVWHHPRPLFRPYWRQISRYASHRGCFVKKFPATSRRLSYFLPSIWTIFLLLGWLPALFFPLWVVIYGIILLIYLSSALLVGAGSLKLKATLMVAAGIVSTHIVYGINFIRGLLLKKLPEESNSIKN